MFYDIKSEKSSREVWRRVLSTPVYSGSVGHRMLLMAVYTGSVWAQGVVNGGLYRQCMGTGCCQWWFIQAVYGHRVLSKRVYTVSVEAHGVIDGLCMGSVGASGSSPALRRRGIDCGLQGWCCGRPSSRPYSYAVRRRVLSMAVYAVRVGAQYVINGGLYRQCRGEWKLPRCVSGSVLRIVGLFVTFPAGNGLICSRGLSVAIPTENVSSGMGFRKESSRLIFG